MIRKSKSQNDFEKYLVREYFKFGSVESVYRKHRFGIPVSYAQYQRVLDKFGVEKAVGPNSKFVEMIEFMSHLAHDNIPFEKLYKKLPHTYQTSATTLYRVLSYIKEGITRRSGVALVVVPFSDLRRVLVAKDFSVPRVNLGKLSGLHSLPMGYANKKEGRLKNIRRILQHEVFTNDAVNKSFPEEVLPKDPEPFMYLDIGDVRVACYQIILLKGWDKAYKFSSYKLKNYEFLETSGISDLKKYHFRAGIKEIFNGYNRYLGYMAKNLKVNPLQNKSLLNKELARLTVELE